MEYINHTKVIFVRAWLTSQTFSSSYSSKAASNCAGVKPLETHRCSASENLTLRAPFSGTISRIVAKITSAGRCVLEAKKGYSLTFTTIDLVYKLYSVRTNEGAPKSEDQKTAGRFIYRSGFDIYLAVCPLSPNRESLDISISLIASFTSSFSTISSRRNRAYQKSRLGISKNKNIPQPFKKKKKKIQK